MKNLIILLILKFWDRIVVSERLKQYTYKRLAFEIVNLSTMLDTLKVHQMSIALIANNSFNWIVVYLTALIKGIPITIISSKYDLDRKIKFIHDSRAKILFGGVETFYNFKRTSNIIYYVDIETFNLEYVNWEMVQKSIKKINKWDSLLNIEVKDRNITPELFKKFKDKKDKLNKENQFLTSTYSSGVDGLPTAEYSSETTILRAMKGMTKHLGKSELRRKPILVNADFSFFNAITFLPIMGTGGEIILSTSNISNEETSACICDTQWYEAMWSYLAEIMSEKNRMYYERWWITKWINTIYLKKRFKEHFGENFKHFIILNDETHSYLKKNLQRMGYEVSSTYGTNATSQLISINDMLIKNMEIKINSKHPSKVPGKVFASILIGSTNFTSWSDTGDIGHIGKNSKLVLHGRKESIIETLNGSKIYTETIEKVVNSHPFVNQCFVFQKNDKLLIGVNFHNFALDIRGITKAEAVNILKEVKNDINNGLPEGVEIDNVVLLPRELPVNEQGKIIKFYYRHTPSEVFE